MATKSLLRLPVSAIRPLLLLGAGALAILAWRMGPRGTSEVPFEPKTKPAEAGPLCPWREPQADMQRFFPEATHYTLETSILSGRRAELAARLGRTPTGDENVLHVYRVSGEQGRLGTITTRRAKGEYGAIELVLAADADGAVRGVRLQRLREPEAVAAELQNPRWLQSFAGHRPESDWRLGADIPDVSAGARSSASAIVDGARAALILLAVADREPGSIVVSHH